VVEVPGQADLPDLVVAALVALELALAVMQLLTLAVVVAAAVMITEAVTVARVL
tara:strand:- start:63 stop:224 length:162 start_codon:yes stop_codon:yes gene_type:complete